MRKQTKKTEATIRVITYFRCSTSSQDLETQKHDVLATCQSNDWEIVASYEDEAVSSRKRRKGVEAALDAMDRGDAKYLVAQRLDRIGRSPKQLAEIQERMEQKGWQLVLNGQLLDTASNDGDYVMFAASSMVAGIERRLISSRTKAALDAKRVQGIIGGRKGIGKIETKDDSGEKTFDGPFVEEQIITARKGGSTLQEIADSLNEAGIKTPQGGKMWRPSSLHGLMKRNGLDGTIKKIAKKSAKKQKS